MPPKKNQPGTVKVMEAKIATLEEELTGMKSTLMAMEQGQAALLALLERNLGKTTIADDGNTGDGSSSGARAGDGSEKEIPKDGSSRLQGDALAEFRHSMKKVELPMFDGDDPAGWISRAEVYFRVQNTAPEVKTSLAQLSMDGPTIHFFNSLSNEEEGLTWDRLKEALLERYGEYGDDDIYEHLTELRQRGSVEEYISSFEYLTAQIPRLPDKQFLGYFLHGLKREIRGRVRSLVTIGDPNRLKVLQIARAVERETMGDSGSGYVRQPQIRVWVDPNQQSGVQ